MHLISALSAGLPDAPDGLAFVRVRGASTLATCYSDFEGTVLTQPATGLVLDSNGSKVVYVNQLVDVEVQDSTGSAVRDFTAGSASPNVEVQSASFLGTDYDSGASAAGNPTTVQAVLDKVITSFGTTDWNVLLGGSAVSVEDALSSMYGIFYNVKGTQYGALGDGSTDDTTPIQNAITAAGTAGGGIVFFPKGTYRITAKLTVPVGVSLWGAGGTVSVISMDHATATALEYGTGTGYSPQEIRNLGLVAALANTGYIISMVAGNTRNVLIIGCTINWDGTNSYYRGTVLISVSATTHTLAIVDSLVKVHTSSLPVIGSETNPFTVRGTTFAVVSAAWAGTLFSGCSNMIASGCTFDMSATTSGSHAVWESSTAITKVSFTGNIFKSGTTSRALHAVVAMNDATSSFVESGNVYTGFATGTILVGNYFVSGTNRPFLQLSVRDQLVEQKAESGVAGAYAVNPSNYSMTVVTQNVGIAASDHAVTAALAPPEGSTYTFFVRNTSGATQTYKFTTGFASTGPLVMAVLANYTGCLTFRLMYDPTDLRVLRAIGDAALYPI